MNVDSDFEGFEEVVARLSQLGQHPVDPAVASAHLQMMAAATPLIPPVRWWQRAGRGFTGKMRVGAAVIAASVAGGTGLAFAGGLPSSAQNVDDIPKTIEQPAVPSIPSPSTRRGPIRSAAQPQTN